MTIDSERDLFERKLQELYELEHELDDVQPRLADEAIDEDVEEFFAGHHRTTRDQLERLDGLFEAVNADPERRESTVLEDVMAEREAYLDDLEAVGLQDVVDAEIARTIERLEISKLETLLTLARRLDLRSDVIESLRTSKTEAEIGLEAAQELPVG